MGVPCSFSAATPVLMADGTHKPISQIKPGDKVAAADPTTGEHSGETVIAQFAHDDTLIDLIVDGAALTTTRNHPFWVVNTKQYTRADHLEAGDKVLTASGRIVTVSGSAHQHRATWHRL